MIRAAAEMSGTGGHVASVYWFATIAKSICVCVRRKCTQSPKFVMMGRQGPDVVATLGAKSPPCFWNRDWFLFLRACGRVGASVLNSCPQPNLVCETQKFEDFICFGGIVRLAEIMYTKCTLFVIFPSGDN